MTHIALCWQIVLQYKEGICSSPNEMAERVISYLEKRGFLQAHQEEEWDFLIIDLKQAQILVQSNAGAAVTLICHC